VASHRESVTWLVSNQLSGTDTDKVRFLRTQDIQVTNGSRAAEASI
jgi:hypothetical protein